MRLIQKLAPLLTLLSRVLVSKIALRTKYQTLQRALDERSLRLCAAADAKMFGYGGLRIQAELDHSRYDTGKTVSDEEIAKLPLIRCDFHGEWKYSFKP